MPGLAFSGASIAGPDSWRDRYFLDCIVDDRPVSLPAAMLDESVKTMELAEAILAGLRDEPYGTSQNRPGN